MDGVTISAAGALIGLAIAIILILKKVTPTYAMIFGALAGGIIGGAGLSGTISYMITGTQGMINAILRIVAAGILAGTLIESGAAERIAKTIVDKMGAKRSMLAIVLATWVLTAVGVFGDVACLTVAPIAIQIAQRSGFHKMGVMMALIGAVRAGNAMSPNPNDIAVAEGYGVPLISVIAVGIIPAIAAVVTTTVLANKLAYKGTEFTAADAIELEDKDLPSFGASMAGPILAIALLILRPFANITIDPIIALPAGGIVGALAMGKAKHMMEYFEAGLKRMSGVAMLLIGTGAISGIISNSELTDMIISAIAFLGLPTMLLAPISSILMGAATASATSGTTLSVQNFGTEILASGISPLQAAGMTNCSVFVFDGLPHGSFFHVSAGSVNMELKERLKLLGFEAINGLVMCIVSVILYGVIGLAA